LARYEVPNDTVAFDTEFIGQIPDISDIFIHYEPIEPIMSQLKYILFLHQLSPLFSKSCVFQPILLNLSLQLLLILNYRYYCVHAFIASSKSEMNLGSSSFSLINLSRRFIKSG